MAAISNRQYYVLIFGLVLIIFLTYLYRDKSSVLSRHKDIYVEEDALAIVTDYENIEDEESEVRKPVKKIVKAPKKKRARRSKKNPKKNSETVVPLENITVPVLITTTPNSVTRDPQSSKRQNVFEDIYANNKWQGSESRSGPGSSVGYTGAVRDFIDKIVSEYNIVSFLDAPCGDFNWVHLSKSFRRLQYTGVDIVRNVIAANKVKSVSLNLMNTTFDVLDIVNDPISKPYDLVMVRHALMHLHYEDGLKALKNIQASGSKYLLTTSYEGNNRPIDAGQHYHINLHEHPFNLPPAISRIKEVGGDGSPMYLELFKLPVLT